MADELIRLSAVAVRALLRRGEVTPGDLVEAAIARIEAIDGTLNALPTRCFDRARAQAAALARQETMLGGLPLVIKDNNEVGGVRSTGGTPIFADRVPAQSDRTVALIEARGGITLAKSNLSELGGANTTNAVFGATRNPWNLALTCGGSSGGSAVALATGQAWLAHGNDLGGSLRIPASFCGILGLRPGPGRIPRRALVNPFDTLFVDGPMARDVADLALFFDAMVGFDPHDPLSAPSPDGPFLAAAQDPARPMRLAWSADLGCLPVADEVRTLGEAFAGAMGKAGIAVHHGAPDFRRALPTLLALRGASYLATWEPFLADRRHLFTADVLSDIERGATQSPSVLAAAERYRADLYRRVMAFLDMHEILVTPAVTTLPGPVEVMWPREIAGQKLDTYVDWIAITAVTSLLSCPILSLPVGFSADGLPFGVQLIGKPRSEAKLFRAAAWIERHLGLKPAVIEPRGQVPVGGQARGVISPAASPPSTLRTVPLT